MSARTTPALYPQFPEVERFEPTGRPFSALEAAQRSLLRRGFSFGPPEGERPIAIMADRAPIAKWSALLPRELAVLAGVIHPDEDDPEAGYRDGAVWVRLRATPIPVRTPRSTSPSAPSSAAATFGAAEGGAP